MSTSKIEIPRWHPQIAWKFKYNKWTITFKRENQIITFEMLELGNIWHFVFQHLLNLLPGIQFLLIHYSINELIWAGLVYYLSIKLSSPESAGGTRNSIVEETALNPTHLLNYQWFCYTKWVWFTSSLTEAGQLFRFCFWMWRWKSLVTQLFPWHSLPHYFSLLEPVIGDWPRLEKLVMQATSTRFLAVFVTHLRNTVMLVDHQ